jgi:hypothetical protein
MKLSAQTQVAFIPMFLGRGSNPFPGDDLMPQLRLCPADQEMESDSFPFPGLSTRARRWQPRLAQPMHDTELALEQVERHLNRLAAILDEDGGNDRPRAA